MAKKFIVVRTQFEGVHHYPDASIQVAFLRTAHRHTFHVEAQVEVFHNDRDLEFIMVKREINKYIQFKYENNQSCQTASCELIADRIIQFLHTKYGQHRIINVSVFEDGENGAWIREDLK